MSYHQIQIGEQGAPAGQYDALVDDVGGEFGGGVLERDLDRLDDRAHRLGKAFGDLPFTDHDLLRHTVHQVAPLDLHHPAFAVLRHAGGTDLLLDALGAALADKQIMVTADIGDDRLVHLVAAHPHRPAVDDAAERQHRHLRRAAADIDDHRAGRL